MTEHDKTKADDDETGQVELLARELFADSLGPNGEVLGIEDDVVIAPDLSTLIRDPLNTLATISDDHRLTGFSMAVPIGKMDPARGEESADTAYIYYTGIQPDMQGRGEVGRLMKTMTGKLKARGYSFLERDCVLAQGYADNVGRAYKDAIIEQHDHTRWPEIGPERFFRIDLSKVL